MTKHFEAFAALTLVAASPALAEGETTVARSHGEFTAAYGPPMSSVTSLEPTYSGLGTFDVYYGVGTASRLTFRGVDVLYDPPADFLLGTLTFYNGVTTAGSEVDALRLDITTLLDKPINPAGDGYGFLSEMLYINNRPNNTGTRESDADFISFSQLPQGAYVYELNQAIFYLYGTMNSPLTLSRIELASGEGFVADAPPYSKELSQIAAVPEPSSWALMLLGFGAIGASMRRRQRASARLLTAA